MQQKGRQQDVGGHSVIKEWKEWQGWFGSSDDEGELALTREVVAVLIEISTVCAQLVLEVQGEDEERHRLKVQDDKRCE